MSWFSRRFEVQDLDTDFNKINEDIPTLKIVFKNIIAGYNTLPWSLTFFFLCLLWRVSCKEAAEYERQWWNKLQRGRHRCWNQVQLLFRKYRTSGTSGVHEDLKYSASTSKFGSKPVHQTGDIFLCYVVN